MNSPFTFGCGTPHKVIIILGELLSSNVKLLGKRPRQNSGPPKCRNENKNRFH